jgi:hypothetical protein
MLDSCFAEGCILVRCPRHYPSHGWTARVRIKHGGSPAPLEVTTYCSIHEWMSYFHDEGGPSVAAPHAYGITSPRRPPSPTYPPIRSSLSSYLLETPPYTPTPVRERYGRVTPQGRRAGASGHHGLAPWSPAILQQCDELRRGGTGGLLQARTRPSTTTSNSHSHAPQHDSGGQQPPRPAPGHPDWAYPDRGNPVQHRASPLSLPRGGGLGAVGNGREGGGWGDPAEA